MADTWRENAIVEAILIIADKKIAQAGYDRTIKGVINKVIDKTKGKYQVRYQDSLFEAFSTSAKIEYIKDQLVSVLIPGNDWDRVKTILGGVDIKATNYQQIPIASLNYNRIGTSGTSLNKNIGLSSYVGNTGAIIDLVSKGYITLNNTTNFINYVKKGNGIALGMKVRTALADGQVGGDYGLRFYLKFGDNITGNDIIKEFTVSTKDVIGQPYLLTNDTIVLTLIKDIDVENFKGISSIEAYCTGFPGDSDKVEIEDIFISDVFINGASVLSDLDLNGYVLHIDYSEKGNILSGNLTTIPVIAQLKVNGKVTTLDVKYYWFRLNGTIFKGDSGKYSGYAGDGWECLNYYNGTSFVPKTNGKFNFNKTADNFKNNTALAPQKVTKILCVAIYDNKEWVRGLALIINNNISNSIAITTKQVIETYNQTTKQWVNGVVDNPAKTVYYLDNGTPTLTCNSGLSGSGIVYTWSVKPARGSAVKKATTTTDNNNYNTYKTAYKTQIDKANGMAVSSKKSYIAIVNGDYQKAVNNWNGIKNKERISGNIYYNFPIKSISDYSIVSCAVTQNGVYKGTASITLYNKTQLEGMYSLNLEHGTQVFQYDGKGNSPASPQIEKPILIKPLTFTLIDNEGKLISHEQIKKNGWIKWIFPNTQSLLTQSNNGTATAGNNDLTVSRADLPLAASSYSVFKNRDSFNYGIANRYDAKKNINYIWLNVKFKDLSFDAYTDFTFPKDGDPGTNGTDYIAKIVPSTTTDRVYIASTNTTVMFDDDGATVANLKFLLYNNSVKVGSSASYWNCPPTTQTSYGKDNRSNAVTYLSQKSNSWTTPQLKVTGKTAANIQDDKPVNIIRAQYGTGTGQNALKYFAEYPICTEFVNTGYRLKVKPKSGFKYAVYLEDGTRPDYDNSLPFEIVVEKANGSYWEIDNTTRTYTWYPIGNIEFDTSKNTSSTTKTCYLKPKNTFNGSDLSSAVLVEVSGVGRIHIPVYMILNRYGHNALNGWDGNSILLNANGDTILAPQIGAGKKESDNSFTGILMGAVKTSSTTDTGLMGYHQGTRSIFLDSNNGNATFGKPGAAQIKITASSGEGTIQSGDYNYKTTDHTGTGLKIKFSSTGTGNEKGPYIRYGSNKFSVSADGSIHAAGSGDIAGWNINDDAIYKHDGTYKTGMRSNGNPAFYAGTNAQNSISPTSTAAYNFFVNHDGYLYSKSGRIATWDIDDKTLSNSDVGMGLNKSDITFIYDESSKTATISKGNGRFWAGNKFIVDKNGKMYSNSAQIGPWTVSQSLLTNGIVGMGTKTFKESDIDNSFGENSFDNSYSTASTSMAGRLWSLNSTGNINFLVNSSGYLFSKAGQIGGWTIGKTKLSATGIEIGSNGYIKTTNYTPNSTVGWQINSAGDAYFNNLYARGTGKIGPWTISETELTNGKVGLGTHNFSINDASTAFNREFTAPIQARIWGRSNANSDASVNFIVDNNGHLYSKAGYIGGWTIQQDVLINGNTGMNSNPNNDENYFIVGSNSGDTKAFFAGGANDKYNPFYVTHNGFLHTVSGLIAGWNITSDRLWAGSQTDNASGIRIKSNGTMNGPNWSIDSSGNGNFTNFSAGAYSTSFSDGSQTSTINNSCGVSGSGYNGSTYTGSPGLNNTLDNWGKNLVYDVVLTLFLKATIGKIDQVRVKGLQVFNGEDAGISMAIGGMTVPSNSYISINGDITTTAGNGMSGQLLFDDGQEGTLTFKKGILVGVSARGGTTWSASS